MTLQEVIAELNGGRPYGMDVPISQIWARLSPGAQAYLQANLPSQSYTQGSINQVVAELNAQPAVQPNTNPYGTSYTPPPQPQPLVSGGQPGTVGGTEPPPGQTIGQMLTGGGFSSSTPISQLYGLFGFDANTANAWLQQRGISPSLPAGEFFKQFGVYPNSTAQDLYGAVSRPPFQPISPPGPGYIPPEPGGTPPPVPGGGGGVGGTAPPPPGPGSTQNPYGMFPQTPPITLPPWAQPTPFQMSSSPNMPSPPPPFQAPPGPNLPTQFTIPPELQALITSLQSNLQGQQAQRESLLSQLQQAMTQQEQTTAANQPMLDLAMQNIQSVLSGQAMSPSLQGLVDAAYRPAEDEGARRLRQAAEESAALRGMSLTDTPIGQPYLEENRRFMEQMGGQRAQAAIGLREQDVAFSERVRQFQEGLKQQAMSNRMDVIRSMGTPEQTAQILGTLGLGAQQAAVSQFGAMGNQAISAADLALRSALGQSSAGLQQYGIQSQNALGLGNLDFQRNMAQFSAGQQNAQLGLASQAQGFQQQLARQQASIQNQLSLMGALGDPYSAYGSMGNLGSNLSQQQLLNQLQLSQSMLGQPINFGNTGMTQNTSGTTPGTGLATTASLLSNLALAAGMYWGR